MAGFLHGTFDLRPESLDLIFVQKLDVQVVEDVHDILDKLRVGGAIGNHFIDVLDGHVTLLSRKMYEYLHLLINHERCHIRPRIGTPLSRNDFDAECGPRRRAWPGIPLGCFVRLLAHDTSTLNN